MNNHKKSDFSHISLFFQKLKFGVQNFSIQRKYREIDRPFIFKSVQLHSHDFTKFFFQFKAQETAIETRKRKSALGDDFVSKFVSRASEDRVLL